MSENNLNDILPSTSGSVKRSKPYTSQELKDLNKLHVELGIRPLIDN